MPPMVNLEKRQKGQVLTERWVLARTPTAADQGSPLPGDTLHAGGTLGRALQGVNKRMYE